MGTLAALHPWLLADTADPFVRAVGRISLAAGPGVAPEPRVDVLAAAEKGAERASFSAEVTGACGAGVSGSSSPTVVAAPEVLTSETRGRGGSRWPLAGT